MKDILKVYGPLVLIGLIAIFVAMRLIDPPPPNRIVFAAGAQSGAYYGGFGGESGASACGQG